MRINELKVRNLLSHKDTRIVFPSGLTAIVGENGAGKTALLDAISYALFKEHSRGVDENLINRRADSAEVSLKFTAGGREYSIEWRIRRKSRAVANMRELPSNKPILIDAGERTVLPEVEKRLGISKEIFMNAIYVRQGEIARLLEAKPADRKKVITELLGIETLERVWESLRSPLKILEERHKKYQAEAEPEAALEQELQKTTQEASRVREKLSALRVELAKLEEKMRMAEATLRELETKREALERLRKELSDKEKEIAAKDQEIRDAGERLRKAREAEEQVTKLQSLYDRSEHLSATVEKLQKRLEECIGRLMHAQALEESIIRVERDIRQYEEEVFEILREFGTLAGEEVSAENFPEKYASIQEEAERSIQLLEESMRETGAEIGECEGARNKHLEDLRMLEEAVDACPLCKQPITPQHKAELRGRLSRIIDELGDRAEDLRRREAEIKAQLELQREKRSKLLKLNPQHFKTTLNRLQAKRAEREQLVRELEPLEVVKREYTNLSGEISEMKSELELLRPTRDAYLGAKGILERLGTPDRLQAEYHRLASELRAMNGDRGRLVQEIESIGFDEARYKSVLEGLEKLRAEWSEARAEASGLGEREKALEGEVERLQKGLENAKEARRKADAIAREISLLQTIRECFGKDGVQRVIRSVARRSLEVHARRFLQSFNIVYSDIRLNDDYDIYLYGPDGEQPIESLSGGEKIAVALSLRLGIAAALAGERMECIIMDEPTIHLDTEKRRELVKLLASLRRERGLLPQAIIVTHDREVEEAADQVYELTRREGYSHIL